MTNLKEQMLAEIERVMNWLKDLPSSDQTPDEFIASLERRVEANPGLALFLRDTLRTVAEGTDPNNVEMIQFLQKIEATLSKHQPKRN
jgi:hypothetical protein